MEKRTSGKIIKPIVILLAIAAIAGAVYFYRAPLADFLQPYWQRLTTNLAYQWQELTPCQQPITVSLGAIDPKFNLTDQQVITAINQASNIWSSPAGKKLFAYATSTGDVRLSFIYDSRQALVDKLKKLGIVVETTKKSYDQLKEQYDLLKLKYTQAKADLDVMVAAFNKAQQLYNAEVNRWNKRGGAPSQTAESLDQTAASLKQQVATINAKTEEVNQLVQDLNTMAAALNKLIGELNLNVDKYNNVGDPAGKEFQEGVYAQDQSGRQINVYEFGDRAQLVRLLAHELGHALGLNHSTGTTDIMYYLNEAGNDKLTPNDLSALKRRCRIK